jgi:formate dehydrogenase subunit gamma
MSRFEPWSEERTVQIIAEHRALEGPLMPILHAHMHTFGHVPEEAVPVMARELNLSRAEVHGVVTFYHDFRRESMGCERLVERAEDRLGIACGDTTADGRVTLEAIYCLGLCATAPSAMLDGRIVGRLDADRLDQLLKEAKA